MYMLFNIYKHVVYVKLLIYGEAVKIETNIFCKMLSLLFLFCFQHYLYLLLFARYAKMWYKGVSFTAEQCALVYLVDAAGTRTTTDTFLDMSQDFTLNVFYK